MTEDNTIGKTLTDMTSIERFHIACNMNKCKYKILNESIEYDKPCASTTILISLNTILKDWVKISGGPEGFELGDITEEDFMAYLFELIIHYKRFYKRIARCHTVVTVLYYSLEWDKDKNLLIDIGLPDELKTFAKKAMTTMETIVNYMPLTYIFNTGKYHPAIAPYTIISKIIDKSNLNTDKNVCMTNRVLLCSADEIDYTCMGLNDCRGNVRTFMFKHKQPLLYTRTTLLPRYIFRLHKTPMYEIGGFVWTYSRLLLVNINKCKTFQDVSYSEIGGIRKTLLAAMKLSIGDSTTFTSNFDDTIKSSIRLTKLANVIIIPMVYVNNYVDITNMETHWKCDKIDYSIEALNDEYFKNYKVSFVDLM